MFVKKISVFLILLAFLVSILQGPLEVVSDMEPFLYVLLIICGAFVGFFNVNRDQETKFLQATLVFVVGAIIFKEYLLSGTPLLDNLGLIVHNIVLFATAGMVATGIRSIVGISFHNDYKDKFHEELAQQEKLVRFVSTWNMLIFFLIAFMFIFVIIKLFFNVSELLFDFLLFVIWVLFLVDLFYIFSKFWRFNMFLKNAWPDLVAVVPLFVFHDFFYVLLFAKFSRMLNIVRILTMFGGSTSCSRFLYIDRLYLKIKSFFHQKSQPSTSRLNLKKTSTKKKSINKKKK